MTQSRNRQDGPRATQTAALRLNRRILLAQAAKAVPVLALAPYVLLSGCGRSSGELNILAWSDEIPDPVLPNFTKETGITVNMTPFSQNEEQINKLQTTAGAGFDLCMPTRDRAPQFKDLGLLKAFDLKKLTMDAYLPAMLESSTSAWTWDGGLRHLPHVWGTEAMAWRTDKWNRAYKDLSFGDLWGEDLKGRIQGRAHSLITGIGLWMDRTGQLPSNRMLDSFKDEDAMKAIWTKLAAFAIEHKTWVKQFWTSADTTKSGFMDNGVVAGQTWDGPVLSLKKEGKPVTCMAPQEGAIAWLDGWGMLSAVKNTAQVYAFLNYLSRPEVGAQIAEGSGYNTVTVGADAHLSEAAKQAFAEAYPDDAIKNLWWRPPEPTWYANLRGEFADKFISA